MSNLESLSSEAFQTVSNEDAREVLGGLAEADAAAAPALTASDPVVVNEVLLKEYTTD